MRHLITLVLSLFTFVLPAQLVVRVTSIPSSTPKDANVTVAGNFNNWNPSDPNYQLKSNPDGTRTISIYPPVGKVEYKFTRGDWNSAEGDANGSFLPNRSYQYDGKPSVVNVAILSWEDLDGKNSVASTASKNVHVLHTNFNMPQLERSRRIWVYLPPDYETSQKRYPVIYMHDGQNLFDNATAFAGEWKIDEAMNQLFGQGDFGAIIVGIENGGWRRLDEYSPWYNAQMEAGGEGKKYIDFVVKTLKPYVDATYRTKSEREFTAMIGSSMGGLITHYAAIEHQDLIGKVGILSPSFWFTDNCYSHTLSKGKNYSLKYYVTCGSKEGVEMVNGVNQMTDQLQKAGFSTAELNKTIRPEGTHAEAFWAQEFINAYQWLFDQQEIATSEEVVAAHRQKITLRSNPAFSELWVENLQTIQGATIFISSLDGKMVRKYDLSGEKPVDIHSLSEGTHNVNIMIQNKVIHSDKLTVSRI